MTTLIGRLHLLLLHLPIGMLLLSAALALWSQWKNTTLYRQAIEHTVRIGALTAVLAAACGWVLAGQGDYDPETVFWHRWTGIAAALLAVSAWWMQYSKWYFGAIYATNAVLIAAGHFGGTITHGEGYLFQYPGNSTAATADPDALAFEAIIQPILHQKCVSCHNPNKKKGDLLLDTYAHIMAGGKHGRIIIPGSTDSSEVHKRVLLPINDEHHMSPKGKPQLSAEEIQILGLWIKAGAGQRLKASDIIAAIKPL